MPTQHIQTSALSAGKTVLNIAGRQVNIKSCVERAFVRARRDLDNLLADENDYPYDDYVCAEIYKAYPAVKTIIDHLEESQESEKAEDVMSEFEAFKTNLISSQSRHQALEAWLIFKTKLNTLADEERAVINSFVAVIDEKLTSYHTLTSEFEVGRYSVQDLFYMTCRLMNDKHRYLQELEFLNGNEFSIARRLADQFYVSVNNASNKIASNKVRASTKHIFTRNAIVAAVKSAFLQARRDMSVHLVSSDGYTLNNDECQQLYRLHPEIKYIVHELENSRQCEEEVYQSLNNLCSTLQNTNNINEAMMLWRKFYLKLNTLDVGELDIILAIVVTYKKTNHTNLFARKVKTTFGSMIYYFDSGHLNINTFTNAIKQVLKTHKSYLSDLEFLDVTHFTNACTKVDELFKSLDLNSATVLPSAYYCAPNISSLSMG